MKTPFIGGEYSLRSHPLSAQTCINLYPEMNKSGAGEMAALMGTPGYKLKLSFPTTGEARGILVPGISTESLYAVIGASVYLVRIGNGLLFDTWDATLIGTLPTSSGPVSLSYNLTQVAVCDTTGIYTAALGARAANSLTGPVVNSTTSSIGGRNSIAFLDGYGIYIIAGTNQFGITALNDFTSINPLNIASAEALPDPAYALMATERELWIFGPATTEIWSVTGAATFPLERIPGGVLNMGITDPDTLAYDGAGSIYWVAKNNTGRINVVRTVGYQTETISTPFIERELSKYAQGTGPFSRMRAYTQNFDGHEFYVLSLYNSPDITWAYDKTTGVWHRRAYQDSNGILHGEQLFATGFFDGYTVALGANDGNLYAIDKDTYTHNGQPIYRERTWPLSAEDEMHRIRVDRLEVSAETGVGNETGTDTNPQCWLDMSFDGGQTFGKSRYQYLGMIGNRQARLNWRKLGMGRRPVARWATNAECKIALLGANMDAKPLSR
jgi:hypothetical protein